MDDNAVDERIKRTEDRVLRLELETKFYKETLLEIKTGVDTLNNRLSKPLPCSLHELEINHMKQQFKDVVIDIHGPKIEANETFRERWTGRLLILGPAAIIIGTVLATWIATAFGGTPSP